MLKDFTSALETALTDNSFAKLSLGGYTGNEQDLKQIHIRRIMVKREEKLSFTYRYKTHDIVKNFDAADALKKIRRDLNDFKTATLFTTAFDLKFENGKLKKSAPTNTEVPSLTHDQAKNRHISTTGKHYLHALGITDDKGNVLKTAQDKYRQIDKYVEILGGLVKNLQNKKLNIADMGAGKGYLTFALYDYLTNTLKRDAHITGVETRADLVKLCNNIAADSDFSNLKFAEGTIQNFDAANTNILIALHACDTATDDALQKGIEAKADLIVVAPCCHKQIRREMEQHGHPDFLTRHGIFMERQAEMATDGIRALILEYFGYHVKVFEFISGEHTAKNVMITAEKSGKARNPAILKQIEEAKARFGITRHYLEKTLD